MKPKRVISRYPAGSLKLASFQLAVDDVLQNNMTYRDAETKYRIPRSTICDRVKRTRKNTRLGTDSEVKPERWRNFDQTRTKANKDAITVSTTSSASAEHLSPLMPHSSTMDELFEKYDGKPEISACDNITSMLDAADEEFTDQLILDDDFFHLLPSIDLLE